MTAGSDAKGSPSSRSADATLDVARGGELAERQESVEHGPEHVVVRQLGALSASHDRPAAAEQRHRHSITARRTQQAFFRRCALPAQCVPLGQRQAWPPETLLHQAGERDVDVVAPEQEMFADARPLEHRGARRPSRIATSVKSDVPPPTSQTSTVSPART